MNRVAAVLCLCACVAVAETSFTGRTWLIREWTHEKTAATTVSEAFGRFAWALVHTSGTNANQMTDIWERTLTISGSGTNEIDLAGGVTNSFGDVLTFSRISMMAVAASSTNGSYVSVGGSASEAFASWLGDPTDVVTVRPGGLLFVAAPDVTGYAVGTNSLLRITNQSTNTASVTVTLGGIE